MPNLVKSKTSSPIIDAVSLLLQQPPGTVPLIIADAPYGIGYYSNYYKDKNPHTAIAHDWNFQIGRFIQACAMALREDGALYLCCRWDVAPLWLPSISGNGLKVKNTIIWLKNNWSAGDLESFANMYEQVLYITKGRARLRGKRWPNVWPFDRIPVRQLLHPTQKPVALLERAIASSSDPDDLVIDPFAGSGSTGEAARNLGRKFLLGDIDPKMVNVARLRLGLPLLDEVGDYASGSMADYLLEFPDPALWGIHPEDLRFIYDELRGNIMTYPPDFLPSALRSRNMGAKTEMVAC